MQKRSDIQISYLIVFLSILTIMIQFLSYYFFASFYLVIGLSCLISIVCCHILLEQSITYNSCFIYSILTLFISLIIAILAYLGKASSTFPYTGALVGIVLINWLVPSLHCFLRNMFEYGTKIENFLSFYKNSSIVFFLFYMIFIVYGTITEGAYPWAFSTSSDTANFTPFLALSTQIEDYLYGLIPLSDIVVYLCGRILIFVPYGFYCTLILRHKSQLTKVFSFLLLPLLIEAIQYIFFISQSDIDDLIYAFIGAIIGSLWFYLTNLIYRSISSYDFLANDSDYHFSNSGLHF